MTSINSQQYGDEQRLLIVILMVIGVSGLHLLFFHNFEKSHILAK
jgi:hypothetical protein